MKSIVCWLGVTSLAIPLAAQGARIDARVTTSSLRALSCGSQTAALPPGPVVTPIAAQAGSPGSLAQSSVTPQTATASLTISNGCSGSVQYSGCTFGSSTASLSVELTVQSPVGGRHWLRLLWSGYVSPHGANSWQLVDLATQQQIWQETRGSFTRFPLYLDVPLDLSQPARLAIHFAAQASWYFNCYNWPYCTSYGSSAGGTMTFALRTEAPVDMPAFGVPCPSYRNTLPVAVGYEPFGVPGRDALEAVLVLVERPFAPAVLFVGASRDQFGPLRLPLDLTPAGAPGCFLLQDMVLSFPTLVAPEGIASVPLLPRSALRGLPPFYLQWLALDPVNPLGAILSNGVTVSVP